MTPAALLAELTAAGFRLRVEAGRLLVSPASRLTAGQRALVAQHKDALRGLVAAPLREVAADDPFRDLPPPDSPHWIPAAEYHAMWAALRGEDGAESSPGAAGR